MDNEAPEGERELVSGLGNQGETNVRDSWGLTYAVFFVLGTSCLFPWNVLITETDYFNKRFHVAPYVPLVADNFENCLAVAFQLPNLLALWAFVHFNLQHRMPPVVQVRSVCTIECVCFLWHISDVTNLNCVLTYQAAGWYGGIVWEKCETKECAAPTVAGRVLSASCSRSLPI